MRAFDTALNSLFILAQPVVRGIVIRMPDIDLIKLEKSCTPLMPATMAQSSAKARVSR